MTSITASWRRFAPALALALVVASPALAAPAKAPFGDKVSAAITYYGRASPYIGTAGLLDLAGGAAEEIKRLGFVAVLSLLGPEEAGGVAAERAAIEAQGLRFFHVPVTTRAPTWEQVRAFARIVEDESNLPILVHCETANRVGAMWAMYRVLKGVDPEVAIEEGRAVGLTSREAAVRARLAELGQQ